MFGQNVEHLFTITDAAARGYLYAEDGLLAVVVHSRVVERQALYLRFLNGPARQAAGNLLHVLLRIAAIDTEGVQLH